MAAQIHDDRYLAEAAREMVNSFRGQRFQHVVALFDQLLQRQPGLSPGELIEQLIAAGGDNLRGVVARSYAYDSCWFCDLGMAECDRCEGTGQIDEGLFCMECHGLGKLRCTVCRGSSFVVLEDIPEFFRAVVAEERLKVAERAFADVVKRSSGVNTTSGRNAATVRRLQHQNQQIVGVLHNCYAFVARTPQSPLAARFNAMVRGVQNKYHELSEICARSSIAAARRLAEGNHPGARGRSTRLARSIEHNLVVARGYVEILNRAGIRDSGASLASEIEAVARTLHATTMGRMVVPVGPAVESEPPKRSSSLHQEAPPVTEFVEELTEDQVEEVWMLFREEWWSRKRTLDETRRMVLGSTVNVAMVRPEGKRKPVIGYVRAVTDGVLKAVIYDFVVAAPYRGAGLGKLLMKRLLTHRELAEVDEIELYCVPELIDMFKQWGFSENVDGTVHLRYLRP